jgi:solute:Na+ symporter, SSS family
MTITFVIIVLIMIGISLSKPATSQLSHTIVIDKKDFRVSPAFILGSVIIMGILAGLYTAFW